MGPEVLKRRFRFGGFGFVAGDGGLGFVAGGL